VASPYNVVAVVVTYDGSRWVNACFSSLMKSNYPVNVFAVDNNSTDNTVALIRENFPKISVIENKNNAGFGEANNQAMRIAVKQKADYVLLLNQDAWIEPDTIGELIKAFQSDPGYGIISPLHYNGTGEKPDGAFLNYVSKSYSLEAIKSESKIFPVDFINAAAWLVSRDCLEKIGGFGYLFHQYGEDRDYIQRLQFANLKLGFVTTTKIFHDRPDKRFEFNEEGRVTWYYTTGCRVRLSDINKPFVVALLTVYFWLTKEMIVLFFSGKVFALVSYVRIIAKTFFGSFNDISIYRNVIKRKTPFLFLK
jgi:N-acetylglucosaminyl-diphospho-decaprenol L-rhamnosyltransferase